MMEKLNLSFLNVPNSTYVASLTFRVSLAVICIILSTAGLVGYAVYCFVVIKNRKSLSNPFYVLTVSMAVPDCLMNVAIAYCVPTMLTSGTGTGGAWLEGLIGLVNDYAWFALLSHMVVVAANRVIAVNWPTNYPRLFAKRRLSALLIGAYLVAVFVPLASYQCRCRMQFAYFSWGLNCDDASESCSRMVNMLDPAVTNSQIVFVLFADAYILFRVYKSSGKIQRTPAGPTSSHAGSHHHRALSRENALMLQFSAVAIVLILGQISFWIIPAAMQSGAGSPELAGFLNSLLAILNCSLNPFLYFTFSSEIRKHLSCKKGHSINAVTVAAIRTRAPTTIHADAM